MPSAIVFNLFFGIRKESFHIKFALCESLGIRPLCSSFPYNWCSQVMILLTTRPSSRSLSLSITLWPSTSISMVLFRLVSLDLRSSFVPTIRSLVLDPLQTSLLSFTQDVDRLAHSQAWEDEDSKEGLSDPARTMTRTRTL